MLFLSLLEVAENSNGTFWLNGKRPEFVFFDYEVFATVLRNGCYFARGTQREYSSKPLKHSIVKRILVFKR